MTLSEQLREEKRKLFGITYVPKQEKLISETPEIMMKYKDKRNTFKLDPEQAVNKITRWLADQEQVDIAINPVINVLMIIFRSLKIKECTSLVIIVRYVLKFKNLILHFKNIENITINSPLQDEYEGFINLPDRNSELCKQIFEIVHSDLMKQCKTDLITYILEDVCNLIDWDYITGELQDYYFAEPSRD